MTAGQGESNTLCVIGLGKLGMPIAACLASKGFRIFGIDVNPQTLQCVSEGRAPFFEPGLDEMIRENRARIIATGDYDLATEQSSTSFILVPTPSAPDGGFSTRYVLEACKSIGIALRNKQDYHLIVLTSTVMPGSTEREVVPVLEAESGKRCGVDFGLCYSPEFVALGSVIRDFLHPDFYLIGESDSRAGEALSDIYRRICNPTPPISRMNFVNAELTKLALNTYVTTKITFANMLARICEQLPGASVDTVTSALGLDSRIGHKYLKGAIGYGGPCFPRDNLALSALIRNLSVNANLPQTVDQSNRDQVRTLASLIQNRLPHRGTVGILGLAYKPNTTVVEESQGLLVARLLDSEKIPVMVHDPLALDNARSVLPDSITFCESLEECLAGSNLLVITTPWEQYRSLAAYKDCKGKIVIDCWRLLDPNNFADSHTECIQLGSGSRSNHP